MPAKLASLPDYLTAKQIAECRGKSVQTVYTWVRTERISVHHKAPGKGGAAMFCTEALRVILDGAKASPTPEDDGEIPNLTDEKALHEQAKRKKAELDLAERAGELVNAVEARKRWAELGAVTRQRVLGVVPRVFALVAAMDDPHDVKVLLNKELTAALTMTAADTIGKK